MACGHVQLIQILEPSYLYSNYLYLSSTSTTMTNHLRTNVINFVKLSDVSHDDYILEIGANNGVCVEHLLNEGYRNVIGIDPAENISSMHNLPIICDFFGQNILPKLEGREFKLIYTFHCCAHIEDISGVFDTVRHLLTHDGVFVMEVGYFLDVYRKKTFDVVYHEHIDYHTCTAISRFSANHDLTLYDVHRNGIQGGSIQFFFSKDDTRPIDPSVSNTIKLEEETRLLEIDQLSRWKSDITRIGNDMNLIINALVLYGKLIAGYGAPAKLTTFMYQFKISNTMVKYIIDDNPYKQNLFTPGLNIPIKPIDHLSVDKVDYIIIFAWNFADEIIQKLSQYREAGMRIIVPFPEIRII